MKIVKVIDEHNIPRNAVIMCGIDVSGSDYVIYSIEKDDEARDSDNLFVSKIIKNNDGTFNMMNIEDTVEKEKMDEVVKELIKYAVSSEADKTTGSVTLSSGKEVNIFNVKFNKEQNISVSKTYISTVKKAVSKVSGIFYGVEEKTNEAPLVESIFEEPKQEEITIEPVAITSEIVAEPMKEVVQPAAPQVVTPAEPEVVSVNVPDSDLGKLNIVQPEVEPVNEVVTPMNTFSGVVANDTSASISVVPEVQEVKTEAPVIEFPAYSASDSTEVNVNSETVDTAPVQASVEEPIKEEESSNNLVFNASQETNLNMALGEVSTDKTIPVDDVKPIREFGEDEPVASENLNINVPAPEEEELETEKVLTRRMGFANSKFFMVVAIAFFISSCVFLGYEAFKYFTMAK